MSANSNSLEISPNSTLTFTKTNNKHEITIKNVGEKTVTYKVQCTVHGKFNIKPRWGVLSPNEHSHVLITMCKDVELSRKGRDKIVVVCMVSPINAVDFEMTASFWRHNICYDPSIEKHQLTCHQMDGAGEGHGDGGDKDAEPEDLRFRQGLFPSFYSIRTPSKYWR
uniref:AT13283p n=1 Tax=Drosophila melanogaster TaxID=7227 RepID=Q8T474_DROME|nr:AT13283p [Drosophila melanogaster]